MGRQGHCNYHWCVGVVCAVYEPPWVCHSPRRVYTGSTLLPAAVVLSYSARAQTQLGICFVTFQDPSSSGNQVLSKCTVPGGLCILIISPVLAAWFPGCAMRTLSQVCHMSPLGSWCWAATVLVDVNHPGSQEDMVGNWEPAHSLVEDAISASEIAASPCLPVLAFTHLPFCLWEWRDQYAATCSPFIFSQYFVLWTLQAVG